MPDRLQIGSSQPSVGQIALLVLTIILFALAGVVSLLRLRKESNPIRIAAKALTYGAITAGLGVIVWHAITQSSWLPLDDNFNALISLGLILALFVLYVQRRRPIFGLDWFIMPIVILLLICAAVFGKAKPHEYLPTAWSWVHRLCAYGGAVAFAIAAAGGAMYLLVNKRLRRKVATSSPSMGSLERLEHVTFVSATLGFAMLTVAAVTGFVWYLSKNRHISTPKVVLTSCVWIVYAIVLHSPINPSFRGRKAAMLSILGFALMVGTIVAVQFMPPSL